MRLLQAIVASAAAAMSAAYVPPHMELPSTWTDVSAGTLIPLEFKSEAAAVLEGDSASSTVTESACMSAADVISKHSGKNGCIAFAVRRPAIANLAAREDKPLDGFGLFGVVKEVGVDDEGTSHHIFVFTTTLSVVLSGGAFTYIWILLVCTSQGLAEFQSNFFSHPLYRDE
ncbi:hypothetical protein ACHAXR_006806, partial [Thalassiosira sp. AJA248-18]